MNVSFGIAASTAPFSLPILQVVYLPPFADYSRFEHLFHAKFMRFLTPLLPYS